MRTNERIPLHDHVDGNSGGRLASGAMAVPPVYTTSPTGGTPSPLNTKGDVWGYSSVDARIPVGTNGQVLTADSTQTLGLKWSSAPSGSLPWFNVKDAAYGAVGDGTTDDTAAINLAIAALVSAGAGVLYFPASSAAYKVTSALTTISVPATIRGDGWMTNASGPTSQISFTSTTATLFTVSANGCSFHDLAMNQTGGTATAGAAITSTGGTLADYDHCLFIGWYIGIDQENSNVWAARRCYFGTIRKYGIKVRNTATPDAGDWNVTDCIFTNAVAGDAAIRIESSGGGRVVGAKINGSTGANRFAYGIDAAIGNAIVTSILLIESSSIENVTTDAVHITTSGTGQYGYIAFVGCQVGLYGNNSGRALNIVAAATGGTGVAGGIGDSIVDGCVFTTDGTARAAISLTNTNNVVLGDIALRVFNARYTSSGDTNTTDNTTLGGGVTGFATPAIVLGTAAAAGAATTVIRSDATVVAFDATSPTTQALGDAAVVGTAAFAARRDHKHAMPALSTATPLVESGSGSVGTALPSSREDHVHPAVDTGGSLVIVAGETHLSDGSTTTYTLDNYFQLGSVEAFNTTTLAYLVVTETEPDQATVSAAGTTGDKITFSYAAIAA